MSSKEALAQAEAANLDLVEIVPKAEPPVCRIMDYGKYKFEQSKKAHEAKRKQKRTKVKEVKFRPGTEKEDYCVKLNRLKGFLGKGHKAKVSVRFRGREIAYRSIADELLKRIASDLDDCGTVEQLPKMEGRQMVMIMAAGVKKKQV